MNRTRIISLILTLALVLSLFTACSNPADLLNNIGEETAPSYSDQTPNPNIPDAGNTANKIMPNQFTSIVSDGYSDGLVFVTLEIPISGATEYCVDKEGNLIFSLPENETLSYGLIAGFHGDYAVLREYDQATYKDTVVLCNRLGEIIRAEDIGATEFLDDTDCTEEVFADGYILARKTTTTFQGSVDEVAVLDSNLEIVQDYSETFANDYEAFVDSCGRNDEQYRDGYLYTSSCYLDLNTGTFSDDVSQLYNKFTLKNRSDFWCYHRDHGFLYDQREVVLLGKSASQYGYEVTPLLDLRAIHGETLYVVDSFSNGTAGVLFEVEDSSKGERYYFSVIGEDGALKYDPVEVEQGWTASADGVYVFLTEIDNSQTYRIEVFNSTGKIAETEYTSSADVWPSIIISDDVIHVSGFGQGACQVYTMNLEPLY